MGKSFQNEIPPARVNLKIDVGKGDAQKKMELPLKMLVLSDFSNRQNQTRIVDREKIQVNKNNFSQVMDSMNLELNFPVENKMVENGRDIPVKLNIKNLDSLKPENIVKEIPVLSRLLAARNLLKDLKSNVIDNRELRKRLESILKNPDATRALNEQLKLIIKKEDSQIEDAEIEPAQEDTGKQ